MTAADSVNDSCKRFKIREGGVQCIKINLGGRSSECLNSGKSRWKSIRECDVSRRMERRLSADLFQTARKDRSSKFGMDWK
jgi:hypothetical protein